MDNLNQILIEGRLTRDPVESFTTAECPLCRFPIANNRFFKSKKKPQGEQDTSYFLVECWGKVAESCLAHLKKGTGVRVVGRLKQYSWKEDRPHERVYIIAEHIQFQPSKKVEQTEIITQGDSEQSTSGEISDQLNQMATEDTSIETGETDDKEELENI